MYNLKMAIIKPKHVVVPRVENTLYSTNKYSCVRRVHTFCIGYFIEHNGMTNLMTLKQCSWKPVPATKEKGQDGRISVLCSGGYVRDKWGHVTMAWCVLKLRMGERHPIWRVTANILNKQSQTADTGWSSSLGVGRVADSSSP